MRKFSPAAAAWCAPVERVRLAPRPARGHPAGGLFAPTVVAALAFAAATAQPIVAATAPAVEAPSCAGVPLAASPDAESPLVNPAKDLRGTIASGPGDREWGEWLAGECLTCHGLHAGARASIPTLAQLDPMEFASALEEYRRLLRPDQGMQLVATRLTPDEVAALASYFASLTPGGDVGAAP